MVLQDTYDDDIIDDYITQDTIPHAAPAPAPRLAFGTLQDQISSSPRREQSPFTTQPTQILATPPAQRRPPTVLVAASSPFQASPYTQSTRYRYHTSPSSQLASSQTQRAFVHSMAPRGTYLNVHRQREVEASQAVAPGEDEPIIAEGSEDELYTFSARANIPRTAFRSGTYQPPQNIVPNTPPQSGENSKAFFDGSRYMFQPPAPTTQIPQKRPIDDMASAYSNATRRKVDQPRQTGPARAQPVDLEDGIEQLEDIPDFSVRQSVQQILNVTHLSVNICYNALRDCHNNPQDAMTMLLERDSPPPKPVATAAAAPAKPSMKRQVIDKGSITQKYSRAQGAGGSTQVPPNRSRPEPTSRPFDDDAPLQMSPKKPLRRLKKRAPALSSSPEPEPVATPVIEIEDDEEVLVADEEASSDLEVVEDESDEPDGFDDRLLKFFNIRPSFEIADLSHQSEEIANLFISKRPFKNLDQVRKVAVPSASADDGSKTKRKSKAKPIGEKVVDICAEMLTGLEAVDELVNACNVNGQRIAKELDKWGINVEGLSIDGEITITSLEHSAKDSGVGTPEPKSLSVNLLKQPANMSDSVTLKDYQVVGLNWLNLLWDLKLSCILADDMGLGKTCQVIAFLSHLYETGVTGPHIVIVPGSTLENWLREFQNFSPNLVVEPYYGSQAEREGQRGAIADALDEINVIVTTYDCACRDNDNIFLRKIGAQVCVFDEGHMLKNSTTKRYKSLVKIRAKHRLLLTGTPLQNNLQELASLLAFLMPETFAEHREDLEYVFKHKTKISDSDHSSLLSQKRIERARAMIAPFILRRKKQQVLKHLPAKHTRVEYCELMPAQKIIYNELLKKQRKVLEDRAAGIPNKDRALNMMRLRQAAIHPLLLRRLYDDDKVRTMAKAVCNDPMFGLNENPDFVFEDLQLHTDFQLHKFCIEYPNTMSRHLLKSSEWMDSGKVAILSTLLKDFKEKGDRTLIFSQFTTVMDILEQVLEELGMPFFRMDGSTPIPKRQDMLDEFYADTSIPVFMLSTKSGGAGINLACANKVIIFDSSFNPQDDIQAENRAHRVGQTREVEVVRLVTKDTIEEQILRLGMSKLALDDRVAGDADEKQRQKRDEQVEQKGMELVERMLMGEKVAELDESDKEELNGAESKVENSGSTSKREKSEKKDETKEEGKKDVKDAFAEMLKKKGVSLAD